MKPNTKPETDLFGRLLPILTASFCLLFAVAGFSQTPTEEIVKSTFQTSSSEKNGLLVLQFSATGVTESSARVYSNIVAQNIANTHRFDVIYLDEAEERIQKALPELLPCFDIGCGVQAGSHLGVRWIVSGHISLREAGLFALNVKLVDVQDNSIEFEETIRFNDENMDRRIHLMSARIARNVPLIGTVVEANNKLAVISVGEQDGISIGDQLVVYRKDTIRTLAPSGVSNSHVRRKNIAIVKITQVGEKISEGVYFQSIETAKPDQFVTTYLDKRRQIGMIDHVRKELDTYERNVYEIAEGIDLSPIQLIDIEKNKWIAKVKSQESSSGFWRYFIIGSGVATAYFVREYVGSDDNWTDKDDWKLLASAGILGYSLYRYVTVNHKLKELLDEGYYKGYLELKVTPELNGAGVAFHWKF